MMSYLRLKSKEVVMSKANYKSFTSSFFRFALGFLVFIAVSFAVTVTLDKYAASQDSAQTAAVEGR